MKVYFTSDPHFGDEFSEAMRGISTEGLMQRVVDELPTRVKLYVLGDLGRIDCFEEFVKWIKAKHAHNQVVVHLGNHDEYKALQYLAAGADNIIGPIKYKGWWLTHIPIHPQELFNARGNIHGHIHCFGSTSNIGMPYMNVNLDMNNNLPVPFDYIEERWKQWTEESE